MATDTEGRLRTTVKKQHGVGVHGSLMEVAGTIEAEVTSDRSPVLGLITDSVVFMH